MPEAEVSVCSPPPSSPCFALPVHPRFASRFPSRFALRSLLRPSLCCSLRSSLLASPSPTEKAPWRLNSNSYRIPGCKRALLSIQIAGRPVAPTSSEATMALQNGKRPCRRAQVSCRLINHSAADNYPTEMCNSHSNLQWIINPPY